MITTIDDNSSLAPVLFPNTAANFKNYKMALEISCKNNVISEKENKESSENEIIVPSSKSSQGIVKDPNFAVVCSFIKIFGPMLHFKELSIATLQHFFDNPSEDNHEDIQALFIKLLRRAGYRVIPEKWEKGLLKFVKEFDETIAWDLHQFGFHKLLGAAKLAIFKHLLESQFDHNDKFKTAVNCDLSQVDLRPQPLGSDIDGLIYWFHEDEFLQIRLYSTEEDEVDCEAWQVLACEVEEIMDVIKYLEMKSKNNPKDIAREKKEERKNILKKPKKKKGKLSKKGKSLNCDSGSGNDESDVDDDNPCARCFSSVHPELILLCDQCDAAYHTACLRPPLMNVPVGDWFCPYCCTLMLVETLKGIYSRISTRIKARSRAANRQNACGINLSNIRQSGRVRKTVDYTFSDFDQEIFEAVDRYGKNKGRHDQNQAVPEAVRPVRQSKRRRMLCSDSDSDSNYEPGSPMVNSQIPKHPERHVYIRRHEFSLEKGSNGIECNDDKGCKIDKNACDDGLQILRNDNFGCATSITEIDRYVSTAIDRKITSKTEILNENAKFNEDTTDIIDSLELENCVNGKTTENDCKINNDQLNCKYIK